MIKKIVPAILYSEGQQIRCETEAEYSEALAKGWTEAPWRTIPDPLFIPDPDDEETKPKPKPKPKLKGVPEAKDTGASTDQEPSA